MIILRFSALFLAFLCVFCNPATAQLKSQKSWIDAVNDATVAIGTIRNAQIQTTRGTIVKKIFAVVGTGVVMIAPAQTAGVPWLVTAKHVLFDPAKNWDPDSVQLRFNWFDQKPVDEYLGISIKLKKDNRHLWFSHPDNSVDLAALPLAISIKDINRDSIEPIPVQSYAGPADLFEGASIIAFGYPGAVGPSYWTRAVLRTGMVAWTSPENPLASSFLIDSLIFPGNSGGPVFKVPTGLDQFGNPATAGKVAFLGIVSQGRKEANPLRAEGSDIKLQGPQGPTAIISEQWVGIGVVEPAIRVKELLTFAYGKLKGANK